MERYARLPRTGQPPSSMAVGAAVFARHANAGASGESDVADRVPAYDFARLLVHATEARSARRNLDVERLTQETTGAPSAGVEVMPLEDGGTSDKDQDKEAEPEAPGPKCGEAIDWQPQPHVPADITADNAAEFAAKMEAALGSAHMAAEMSWDLESDGAGKVIKTNFVLKTTIIRARYAGGRASKQEKALIRRVVAFVKAHEERHRDISRRVSQQAVCDALGQSLTAANATLVKAMCDKEPTAQEKLDAKEGKLEWVKDASGAVVDFKAVGVKANYHQADCE